MKKTKIYMLPGLMCDERLWSRLREYFDTSYDLVHVPIPKSDSFDEICELLDKEFKEEKINLLGFSLGGYISSYYASKYPNKINKLILVSASCAPFNEIENTKRRQSLELINKFGFKGIASEKIKALIDDENDEELIKIVQNMYSNLGLETLNYQMGNALKRVDLKEKLLKEDVKIHFYYANKDRLVNHKWLEDFKQNSNNTFESFDSISHMVPLEKPYELSVKIKEWI